ncbi:myosin-11-like isoform X2 [Dreissena polymorpha]|uniref:myosin-11-like isoform X2 n=1 Tax=Dreissena polymorpha TaxID=45954 RepID=UPI002263F50C|nr:myosin-11-like isoform X2 [Dreissena polymorpha]
MRYKLQSCLPSILGLPVCETDANNTDHTRLQVEIDMLKSELTRVTGERDEEAQKQMKIEQELTDLKHEIERAYTERKDQATAHMKYEEEITQLKSEQVFAKDGYATLKKELQALKEDNSRLQKEIERANTKREDQATTHMKYEEEITQLKSEQVFAKDGNATLTKELQALKEDIARLQKELQTSDLEKEERTRDLQELLKANNDLETELQKSDAEKGQVKLELQELQKAKDILQTELQKSDSEKDKLKHDLQDLQKARDFLQSELTFKTKEEVKLSALYKESLQTTKDLQKKLQQSESENKKITNDFKELQKARDVLKTEQKADSEIEKLTKDKQVLQKDNGLLQDQLKSRSEDVAKLMNDNNDKNKAQRQLRQDLDKANAEIVRHKKDLLDVQKECANLEKQLQQEKQRGSIQHQSLEKSNTKSNTGASYMVNLNDENRPDKVAERFRKLYNDEWTDCLEVLKLLLSEEKVCQMLLGICVKIYTTYANAFDKRQKEHAWLKADTELAEYLNARLKSLNLKVTSDAINSYWTMCKEICKSMIAHDPPMYMDTDTDKHGITFDTKLYEGYTKRGSQIDFVVWPALYLEKNGPLLHKGVAQCK